LEAEAVKVILRLVELGALKWVTSEVLAFEVDRTPNVDRRETISAALLKADRFIDLDESIILEAERIEDLGFRSMDALHLASANVGNADYFLTVDDTLLRKAKKIHNELGMTVANPLKWIGDLE